MSTRAKKAKNAADPPVTQHSAGNIAATLSSRQARATSTSNTRSSSSAAEPVSDKPPSKDSSPQTGGLAGSPAESVDTNENNSIAEKGEKAEGTTPPSFQFPGSS